MRGEACDLLRVASLSDSVDSLAHPDWDLDRFESFVGQLKVRELTVTIILGYIDSTK